MLNILLMLTLILIFVGIIILLVNRLKKGKTTNSSDLPEVNISDEKCKKSYLYCPNVGTPVKIIFKRTTNEQYTVPTKMLADVTLNAKIVNDGGKLKLIIIDATRSGGDQDIIKDSSGNPIKVNGDNIEASKAFLFGFPDNAEYGNVLRLESENDSTLSDQVMKLGGDSISSFFNTVVFPFTINYCGGIQMIGSGTINSQGKVSLVMNGNTKYTGNNEVATYPYYLDSFVSFPCKKGIKDPIQIGPVDLTVEMLRSNSSSPNSFL